MRLPPDPKPSAPGAARPRRRHRWVIGVVVALIAIVAFLQILGSYFTNYLWFRSVGLDSVWRTMIERRVDLALVFIAIFFVAIWSSLLVVDRIARRVAFFAPDIEFVRRFQAIVGPRAVAIRTIVSLVLAIAVGAGAESQWLHWLLFTHAVSFGKVDPQFHRDVSFYVFRLPFLSFLVDWALVALLVILIVTVLAHFLNGAIRFEGGPQRIDPRALAHVSLILGVMALVRAAGYFYVDRFDLALSNSGLVKGAGYTDVHVRLPAISLLAIVSLVTFVILAYNVYQRNWVLPVIGVGLWVIVALVVGVIVPAAIQTFEVAPAQSHDEQPYIERNIEATRYAMNINTVQEKPFLAAADLTKGVAKAFAQTFDASVLWDPVVTQPTFQRIQAGRTFYTIPNLAIDRYKIGGKLTPVVIGARQLSSSGISSPTWVNTHIEYTHGYGVVLAQADSSAQSPQILVGDVPPQSSKGAPSVHQPAIYYGLGESGYKIVDTSQQEIEYASANGSVVYGQYQGAGGVPIGGFWSRLAFALKFHDVKLLISNLITAKSRLVLLPDVRARVQQAAPFLQVDANPYPVIGAGGHVSWIVDAYTTTDDYPYAENADTSSLSPGSGLATQFNYVRNSVKVTVDAYTGEMHFYVVDPHDPLIESYEEAFPGFHWQPLSAMPASLRSHLRYPQDLLSVQGAMFGRYHVTNPSEFYSQNAAWALAQATGRVDLGSGAQASGAFQPVYELIQPAQDLPLGFELVEPLVYAAGSRLQQLSAILEAGSDYDDYGHLIALEAQTQTVPGPAIAAANIDAQPSISKAITLLGQTNTHAIFGTFSVIPVVDSLVYVCPLYVTSTQTPLPRLENVIAVYGSKIVIGDTLQNALDEALGLSSAPSKGGGTSTQPLTGSLPDKVAADLAVAETEFAAANVALRAADLGTYQQDVQQAEASVLAAEHLIATEKKHTAVTKPTRGLSVPATTTTSTTAPLTAPASA